MASPLKIKLKYLDCSFSPEVLRLVEAWNDALRTYEDKCYGEICKYMAEEVDQHIMRGRDDLQD